LELDKHLISHLIVHIPQTNVFFVYIVTVCYRIIGKMHEGSDKY